MKKIPMSQQSRLKDALRRRKLAQAGRLCIVALALTAAASWAYVLLYDI